MFYGKIVNQLNPGRVGGLKLSDPNPTTKTFRLKISSRPDPGLPSRPE